MRNPRPLLTRALLVLACLVVPARLAAQATGTVTGQIVNEATGKTLGSATVALAGTADATVTDREGSFVLLRVPAGERSLLVSYPGLTPKTVRVNVAAGENPVPTITLSYEVYRLDSFVVAADRHSLRLDPLYPALEVYLSELAGDRPPRQNPR
ncbi:MAG: carboxypeptidase-like regulatory domain-containing protein [Verrucomicrobia bacterium]|nr:carboxypeptidase-like regulatory domain-containing protein [Verrucomicrobiota bacterium]